MEEAYERGVPQVFEKVDDVVPLDDVVRLGGLGLGQLGGAGVGGDARRSEVD